MLKLLVLCLIFASIEAKQAIVNKNEIFKILEQANSEINKQESPIVKSKNIQVPNIPNIPKLTNEQKSSKRHGELILYLNKQIKETNDISFVLPIDDLTVVSLNNKKIIYVSENAIKEQIFYKNSEILRRKKALENRSKLLHINKENTQAIVKQESKILTITNNSNKRPQVYNATGNPNAKEKLLKIKNSTVYNNFKVNILKDSIKFKYID